MIKFENNFTDVQLFQIFPESKLVLDDKIDEWAEIKKDLLVKEIIPALKKITSIKDDFSRWFYTECYKLLINPKFTECLVQLSRLRRLKILAADTKHSKNIVAFQQRKEIAKQTPIQSLYNFQKVRRTGGGRITACCPFHNDKTPSFLIDKGNKFHCFSHDVCFILFK